MATKEYWCFSRNTRTYPHTFAYPHGEERKPFSTLKSERKTALTRAKCCRDGDKV